MTTSEYQDLHDCQMLETRLSQFFGRKKIVLGVCKIYRVTIVSYSDMKSGVRHNQPDFQAMAELRYQIRRFLRFSETAARRAGIEPRQHQLLLAIRGLPDGLKPTIRVLAERMQLQHHSTVELVDRLVERGFVCRLRATDDRRQVFAKLTREGEEFLQKLSLYHLQELQSAGPAFVNVLHNLIQHASSSPVSASHHKSSSKIPNR
jgi:DNA-binding MarR family transcriptional regulator